MLNRLDHDKLDDLISRLLTYCENRRIERSAARGLLVHLFSVISRGGIKELRSWLYEPATFETWLASVTSVHPHAFVDAATA
jgi:hypothetical protein